MQRSTYLSSKKIGVIGYGLFGKFLCEQLFKDMKIFVYSPHLSQSSKNPNIYPCKSLAGLAKKTDLIIPAVPISEFKNIILEIKPFLNKETIIMDVCSVKEYPVEIMKKYLTSDTQIIASHPLFGPKPFEKNRTLAGSRMVIQNISANKTTYAKIIQYFKSFSIEIIEMDEKEHDKLMAQSQFFTQLLRHVALAQNLHATPIDTPAANLLFEAFYNIGTKEQLLLDMIKYNHYCQDVLNLSLKTLSDLQKSIKNE